MAEVKDFQRGLQYVSDEEGEVRSVIVPIDLWHEVVSEHETNHLLKSEKMRERIAEARRRTEGIPVEDAFERLGV